MHSAYILKADSTGFLDKVVHSERKKGIRSDLKVYGLKN